MSSHAVRAPRAVRWVVAAVITAVAGASAFAGTPGLVKEKPAEGRYVETDQGFMVPYKHKIPGTEIVLTMVPIPGGTFKMGSPDSEAGHTDAEGPQVEIVVEPFWMSAYEITWDQWDQYIALYDVAKNGELKTVPYNDADGVSIPTPIFPQEAIPIINRMGREGGFPVGHVGQLACKQFTKYISRKSGDFFRLPSEAEWEYAARAGTTTAYFWGDDPAKAGDYAWYFDNSEWKDGEHGHPDWGDAGWRKVGEKKPNPWGLYDIYGNQAEWVLDQWDADHYKKLAAKGGPVKAMDAIRWPDAYYGRSLRGGSWDSDAVKLRSASRGKSLKEWKELDPQLPQSVWYYTEFWFGFRPIRPLNVPATDKEKLKFWEPDTEDYIDVLRENTKQVRVHIDKVSE
ncbi:MAG: SUMF1/EgtB/PvdO family nonheme iron enzyme [Phycisphaera sp.]|nr:SUMF1/EgtB/PvdO family nonheme iron enzyme [Phycisphaera sp.]